MQWLLQNHGLPGFLSFKLSLSELTPPSEGQKLLPKRQPRQADGQAHYLLGLVLEAFFKSKGAGGEQPRFVSAVAAPRVDPVQPVVPASC